LLACRRHVRIWSIDGKTATLADDETSWDILTIFRASSEPSGAPARTWNALWLPPSDAPFDRQYVFEILTANAAASRCTVPFSLRNPVPGTMPVPAYFADQSCPEAIVGQAQPHFFCPVLKPPSPARVRTGRSSSSAPSMSRYQEVRLK
jgi:hypothetical protein